ncbi:MAG: hypothetical protein ACNA7W_03345 [Pseudomonadales bacterium]
MVLGFLAASPGAGAHAPAATHGCAAPSRPADDQDDALWQAYLGAVDDFRGCISDYAAANQAAAAAHTRAAHDAVEVWNRFVRDNLNVPQDFPWPPPGAVGPR